MAGQLEGKTVIVTGAARGLGREYAERMASEGAEIVVGDVRDCTDTVQSIVNAGGRATSVALDVTDMYSCTTMAETAISEYGKVDVLVNNAALYGGLTGGRFETLDPAEWQRVLDVNITGVWNCCKAVIAPIRKVGAGASIINIASLAAVYGLPFSLHYAMSKAAVIGMTRSLARELGRDWVRVNAVAPSAVMTEGTEEFFGDKLDRAKEIIASGQTLQRNLEVGDLAGTIVYLASDASNFVTGQTIMVDGGTVYL